jgi:hypothetical protein
MEEDKLTDPIIAKLIDFYKVWNVAINDFKALLGQIEMLIKKDPNYKEIQVELLDFIDMLWAHLNEGYNIQTEILTLHNALIEKSFKKEPEDEEITKSLIRVRNKNKDN